MKKYTITLTGETASFYSRIAKNSNLPVEKVLSDSLFKFAGDLAVEAICMRTTKEPA